MKAQAGQMILWDGSDHDWLEGRGPRLCLMGAIDDRYGRSFAGWALHRHSGLKRERQALDPRGRASQASSRPSGASMGCAARPTHF